MGADTQNDKGSQQGLTSAAIASSGGMLKANNLSDVASIPTSRTNLLIGYDLACQLAGKPTASQVLLAFVADRAFTLSAAGHQGKTYSSTAATAQTDFLLAVNGVTKATLRFAVAGTAISIVSGTSATIAVGNVITITAPASPDSTLADLAFTVSGTLL